MSLAILCGETRHLTRATRNGTKIVSKQQKLNPFQHVLL